MAGVSRRGSPRIHAPGKPGCSAGRLSGPWHRRGRRCQDSAPVRPLERSTGERGHLRVIRSRSRTGGRGGWERIFRGTPAPPDPRNALTAPLLAPIWAILAKFRRFEGFLPRSGSLVPPSGENAGNGRRTDLRRWIQPAGAGGLDCNFPESGTGGFAFDWGVKKPGTT